MSIRLRFCLCLSLLPVCWACQGPAPSVLSDPPPTLTGDDANTTGDTGDGDTTSDAGAGGATDNVGAGGTDAPVGTGGSDGAVGDTGGTSGSDASGGAVDGNDSGSGSDTGADGGDSGGSTDGGDTGGTADTGGTNDPPDGGDPGDPGDPPPDNTVVAEGATLAASLLTPEEIVAELNAIGDLQRRVTETEEEQNLSALRRVQAYRMLLGLRTDITIDPNDVALADAAAEICMQLGMLTHSPSRPSGMSDEEYQLAQQGAAESNLASRYPIITIPYSIDLYMDDSDASNISRIGHRRWIMSPVMSGTGFGLSSDNRYSGMHVFPDADYAGACFSNPSARQEWNVILYPRWGYMPRAYFANSNVAWSVSLRGDRFNANGVTAVDISVRPADADNNPTGAALNITYFNRSDDNYGCQHPVLIFRPQGVQVMDGQRYVVSVSGITDLLGNPAPLEYWVEFFTAKITVVP